MRKIARAAAALLAVGFALWFLFCVAAKGRYQAVGPGPVYVLNTATGCLYRSTSGGLVFAGCVEQWW